MPLSTAKRAWIALAVLAVLAAAGTGAYLHYYARRAHLGVAGAPALGIRPASPQQAERTLSVLNELPGDAPALAYIDVETLRRLRVFPLSALLGAAGDRSSEDRDYQQFMHETGFDYTRDLDRAAVAFWPATLGTPPNAARDDRAVAVVDGRFDQKKIQAYALKSGRALTRGTQTIYEIPGHPPVSLTFFSPTRIAISSGAKSKELLVTSPSTARDPAFQARIDRVAGAPLFAVARTDNLPNTFYANFKNSQQIESLARSVRGLILAAQPQGGVLQATLDAETTSVSSALAITTLLEISRMGASMALSDPKASSRMTTEQAAFLDTLVRELKVTRQNRWVRLSLDITPAMLGTTPRPSRQTSTSPHR